MFLSIVIISIIIGLLFFVVAASLIAFIYNSIRRNMDSKKKSAKVLMPSAIIFVLLIGVNIFLIVTYIYKNRENILNKTSDGVAMGLASTFQNFEKNWDKNRLKQLENLTISLSEIKYEVEEDKKQCMIELIFENRAPADMKLYFSDLLGNNYLVACDKDDFVYSLYLNKNWDQNIPLGKSRYIFIANAPNDIEITHVRYVDKNIMMGD
jgi:hypothetical protein